MASGGATQAVPGVLMQPLEEVKPYLRGVCAAEVNATTSAKTFVRQDYAEACEHGVNHAINVYFQQWHLCCSMSAYFSNDTVALPGCAKFFATAAERAKADGLQFLDYQNMRGGKVVLASLHQPKSEYYTEPEGDALAGFQLALAMNKMTFNKLRELHKCARENEDPELQDFVNSKLHEAALATREMGSYVSELERVGTVGLSQFQFDRRVEKRHGLTLSATVKLPVTM
ncbi:ferritin-chloroplastic [Micractinium conductrix]|uniref:Ferritin n=1 Tax=Micractinium conductrix TaxID=554055 RepID=A0A2P6V1W2_9CHLO|nr:ferritin-chloroplastic [Micractinium conductrix]|eukprot:PSC68079.1 ferritin-chloroplastic [Micractinium conductrix]